MQINHLFEIVYILLNKNQVTAKELAERFEVSTRTIYRDIETLCEAGIPLYTNKGKGGGISLLDHFVLNKSVLSPQEQQEILVALQGLNATPYLESKEVLSKLDALFGNQEADWVTVDFAHWNSSEKEKFESIKWAILNKQVIAFEYYNARMERLHREVEPLQLAFKDRNWYLKAYCKVKDDIRLFKLTRIKMLTLSEEHFERRLSKEVKGENNAQLPRKVDTIKLWVDASQAYRVYDEFEDEQIIKQQDGSFQVEMNYPIDEWVYGYILSYGPCIKVIEPAFLKKEVTERLKAALELCVTE